MPPDYYAGVVRAAYLKRKAEWHAAFAAELQRVGAKAEPELLQDTAVKAYVERFDEPPALAARLWVELNGLPAAPGRA